MEEKNRKREPNNTSEKTLQPLQNKLLGEAEEDDHGNHLSQGHGGCSPDDENGLNQIETPLKSRKRLIDPLSEIDTPDAKRARSPVQDVHPQQALEVGKQRATSRPLRPSYSSTPYAFVFDWLETIGTARDIRCQSDTKHSPLDDGLVSKKAVRSLPDMSGHYAANGLVPPTSSSPTVWPGIEPATLSTGSSKAPSPSSGKSLVENARYRTVNLAKNEIHMRPSWSYPEHIASLVDRMAQDRLSPGPQLDEVRRDQRLQALRSGVNEAAVETYFHSKTDIFHWPMPQDTLQRTDRLPMAKHTVPNMDAEVRVSNPIPDLLYGYNEGAFNNYQQPELGSLTDEMVANTQGLTYPFLAVEFKGDSPGGSCTMRVAENQCLGGSAACVNTAERLNDHIRRCQNSAVELINSSAFSIAMDGLNASLYVSWKHGERDFNTAMVDSFALQSPKQYVEFRKYVRNIIDWGRGERFKEIQKSMDILLKEGRMNGSGTTESGQ